MNNLRYWRQEFELSQIELGIAAEIPRYKIQMYENGLAALSPQELERIAGVLNLSVTENGTLMAQRKSDVVADKETK